ncbi:CoA transferase [Alcaligenaceae bacterium]|nr:CoA transferase [Alcaligenaceae bacterium]
MIDGAYAGLRVLDVSQGIAGPYCGQMLQQLGADVIKVEPHEGDWSRKLGKSIDGLSALAMTYNRGKRSIALDLKSANGQEIMRSLVTGVDILIQNFRPTAAEKLGIGYSGLSQLNPRLIYASISGYGTESPWADYPVTDLIAQAVSGLAIGNADSDGKPRSAKPYIADLTSGMYTAHAIGAALFARERSGNGGQIKVSLLAALAALQNGMLMENTWRRLFGGSGASSGTPASATVPQGAFRSRDGYVVLASLDDAMFWRICDVLALSEWVSDPRMGTAVQRLVHAEEINQKVAALLSQKTSAEWTALFQGSNVLYAAVNNLDDFMSDPRVVMQGLLQGMPLPFTGDSTEFAEPGTDTLPIAALPGATGCDAMVIPRAPYIGEHTDEIMAEFGYSSVQVERLIQSGVLGRHVSQRETCG